MQRTQRALLNIKHDLELAKELIRITDKLSLEARTKVLKCYISEFDLSIVDRLLLLVKGKLKDLDINYEDLGEFYTGVTGKDYAHLTRAFLALFYVERNDFEEEFALQQNTLSVENSVLDSGQS